jgi:ceramide glucosyltransferase
MELVFVLLAVLLFIQSIVSFFSTMRFARYTLAPQTARTSRNAPKAVVILPCKGLEHDFEENVRAYLTQDYRDYEVIFVTESEHDPAYPVVAKLIKQNRRAAWLIVAGKTSESGQKVHNLSTALDSLNSIDRRAEVLIFADSDARPAKMWLADLVAPLNDRSVGATTGFRWYVPVPQSGPAAWLLSAWNASALAMLGERSGLAWGGATAIWRDSFGKWGIQKQWQGALSDDYALTSALREIGQRIKFVPGCLVASHTDANWQELLEFTTRQLKITRVYAPRIWQLTCFSHLLFNFSFWGGLFWLVKSGLAGSLNLPLFSLLTCTYALGAMTAWTRATVAAQLLTAERDQLWQRRWVYALAGPLVSLVYLYNIAASAFSRRISWRGIDYEMVSPNETRILHHPTNQPLAESPAPAPRRRKAPVRSS